MLTQLCAKICYALKSYKQYPNVRSAWDGNYAMTQLDTFVADFNRELRKWVKKGYTTLRIHVSGDFYSIQYLFNILQIIVDNPDVTFYAYTKQWRDPDFVFGLTLLNMLPNCIVFASTDQETVNNKEKIPAGFKEAFVVSKKKHTSNNKLILCPQQAAKIESCEKCGLCFKSYHKQHDRGVVFIEH